MTGLKPASIISPGNNVFRSFPILYQNIYLFLIFYAVIYKSYTIYVQQNQKLHTSSLFPQKSEF